MTRRRIKVLLAEDHHIVREGFRSLLKHEDDIEVVGEAETGRQAVALVKKLRPAVVVMDIAMPSLNGLEATRQIRQKSPETRIIILSAHSDDAYVEQALELGAAGFLLKQTSSHELATAIREVQKGGTFFDPAVTRRLARCAAQARDRQGKVKRRINRLSSREVEVLQLIAEGKPNKEVAAELGVSFKTVDKHRQHLMSKLDIHDVAGLTRYAIAEGIIESTIRLTVTGTRPRRDG
jgi:DNA-binding NarL/FixJ family response regulator